MHSSLARSLSLAPAHVAGLMCLGVVCYAAPSVSTQLTCVLDVCEWRPVSDWPEIHNLLRRSRFWWVMDRRWVGGQGTERNMRTFSGGSPRIDNEVSLTYREEEKLIRD